MTGNFERSIRFTLLYEGGYVNHPDDRGGPTKFGISKRNHPEIDIASLTVEQAKEIYQKEYWGPIQGDDLPFPLAVSLFDYSVTSGISHAVKDLQGIIGAHKDGILGSETIVKALEADPKKLAMELQKERVHFLCNIVKSDPSQLHFLEGWMIRVFDLSRLILGGDAYGSR